MRGILDGGAFAGRDPTTGEDHSIERLIASWDAVGIEGGLVASYRAIYQDAVVGNQDAVAWAQREPTRVVPLGILVPTRYGETARAQVDRLLRQGIRIAAVLSEPSYHTVRWDAPAISALGEAASAAGLVLQAGIRDESELGALANAWGGLDIDVLVRWTGGRRYQSLASELVIAARCPRFYFDVGNLCSSGAIAFFAERIGARRAFFASNAPHHLPAPGVAIVREALLSPDVRDAIERGTLRKAIGWSARPESVNASPPPVPDPLATVRSLPKVDMHWHHDSWNLAEPGATAASQRALWDRYHYVAVISSAALGLNHDMHAGNASTAAWMANDRRCFGWIVIDPTSPDESVKEIGRRTADPRFVGLKTIQDLYGLKLDAVEYEPILQEARRRGLPILAHLGGLEQAAARFPEVTFIAAHANWARARHLVDLPNVAFDLSTSHALGQESRLSAFVREAGPGRVLFGSDGPLIDPAWTLAKLEASTTAGELASILLNNAFARLPRLGAAPALQYSHE